MELLENDQITEISSGPVSEKYIVINWLVNNVCNYRCSYCDSALWSGSNRGTPWSNLNRFINDLEQLFPAKRLHFQLTGGEPTIWTGLSDLLSYCSSNGHIVGLTTNGSRALSFWENHRGHFNWVNVSYHSESANHEHLLRLVELLAPHTKLSVRVMMNPAPEQWKRCLKFIDTLKDTTSPEAYFIEVVPLTDPLSVPGPDAKSFLKYTEDQWQTIHQFNGGFWKETATKKYFMGPKPSPWDHVVKTETGKSVGLNPSELIVSGRHRFKGWTCYAGIDNFFIDQDGNIVSATCRESKPIGNINQSNWHLSKSPVICPFNTCLCGTDISIPKRRVVDN